MADSKKRTLNNSFIYYLVVRATIENQFLHFIRFYVKSILGIEDLQNYPFLQSYTYWILILKKYHNFLELKLTKVKILILWICQNGIMAFEQNISGRKMNFCLICKLWNKKTKNKFEVKKNRKAHQINHFFRKICGQCK